MMRVLILLLALPVLANCALRFPDIYAAADCYDDEASKNFRKSLPALADALDGNVPLLELNFEDVADFVVTALHLRREMSEESLMCKYFVNMMLFAVGWDDNVERRTESLRMQFILGTLVSFFNHDKMSQVPWDKVDWGELATSSKASKEWPQNGSTLFLCEDVFRQVLPAERLPLEQTLPKEFFLSVAILWEHALESFCQGSCYPEVDARLASLWKQIPNIKPVDFIAEDAVAGFVYFQTRIGQEKRGDKVADILRAALPLLQ